MKITLRTYLFTALSALVLFAAEAQTSSPNGSRLNIGQKRDAAKIMASKSRSLISFKTTLDKNLKIVPSKAINSYYRSVMLQSGTTNQNEATTNRSRISNTDNSSVSESKNVLETAKSEDNMFANDKIVVRNVYPNPANEFAAIEYNITGNVSDAKILIYNVLLSGIGDYDLNKNEKQLRVNTQDMPTGVYYYQLMIEGKKVATKKLIVRH
jgi:Secretion system C-terminal sorting domain